MLSSIQKRGSLSKSSRSLRRLCSASATIPSNTDAPSSAQTASTASSRQPPGEHAQLREQPLLLGAQQLVAPVERRSQRLLPVLQISCAAGQQFEAIASGG